jgi:CRISPR-associated protein Cmr2
MLITAVTFAPVQSFIRSSRKLRDLYGSSLLLSHLARALYNDASQKLSRDAVISPAEMNSTRGVPNTLLILGAYSRADAEQALFSAWKQVLQACRKYLQALPYKKPGWVAEHWDAAQWQAGWGASWEACGRHSWELFHGQGPSIAAAESALSQHKQRRAWEIPNWTGESSTLSSTDAIVRPRMAEPHDPRLADSTAQKQEARELLAVLRHVKNLGEAFADENEEISLSELVKRLVTYRQVAVDAFGPIKELAELAEKILPERFKNTSTHRQQDGKEPPESIVWFMADGDEVGDRLRQFSGTANEEQERRNFSRSMRQWADGLYSKVPEIMGKDHATVVYAGGDDLFGALHESSPGAPMSRDLLFQWLKVFPELWKENGQEGLTASMGLVWADHQVPQREALQHARDAESSAKARGRNRFALRLVYAGGNHLQWTCPWDWLQPILSHYRDREGRGAASSPASSAANGAKAKPPSWRHLAEDLIWLQERHAIGDAIHLGASDPATRQERNAKAETVARGLLQAYFPGWNPPDKPEKGRRLDQWLIDLALVMSGLERWRDASRESTP